jgi:uncharacterized protein
VPLPINRRKLLGAASVALAVPLIGLVSRRMARPIRIEPAASPYGPIAPVRDLATGLPLLQLPRGFTYQSFGWAGDAMADGTPSPGLPDGMAVVRSRMIGGSAEITLIRNHEATVDPRWGRINANALYDTGSQCISHDAAWNPVIGPAAGGTTTLVFRGGRWVSATPSLGGTWHNCAGGPTPWGTWLTCEEQMPDFSATGGKPHGYVFEVSPDEGQTSAVPITAMGRFNHEAVAVDPVSGALFLTEDARNQAGLYRFVPRDGAQKPGALEQGGTLWMAKVAGEDRADLLAPKTGDSHQIEWVRIDDPNLPPQPFTEAPFGPDNLASGPFVQGRAKGGLRMSRLEGAWYSAADRLVYLVDTSSGSDSQGATGWGDGSLWTLDPATDRLTCRYQSDNRAAANNIDNVTVSPRGGVLICENGDEPEDATSSGQGLLGLTASAETYVFARNNVMLGASEIRSAGKLPEFIAEGDHRQREWAGVSFDPTGRWLFANIQTPGMTFAITGPWEKGLL